MNLTDLFYFTVLAREKSFTKAARQLHITQQSLSAHVAAVEKELGCPLVIRHIPLELTYGGQVFLRYARQMEQIYGNLLREFGDITANQQGVLRIGVAFTRGRVVLPSIIAAFQKQYPKVEVQLVERPNKELQEDVLRGRTDLAIGYFTEETEELEYKPFYEEEVALALPEKLSQRAGLSLKELSTRTAAGRLEDLAEVPFILGSQDDIAGSLGRKLLHQADFKPYVTVRSYNVETMLTLCSQGVGACFCPRNLAASVFRLQGPQDFVLLPLGKEAQIAIRFAWKKTAYPWQVLKAFQQIALDSLFQIPDGKNKHSLQEL